MLHAHAYSPEVLCVTHYFTLSRLQPTIKVTVFRATSQLANTVGQSSDIGACWIKVPLRDLHFSWVKLWVAPCQNIPSHPPLLGFNWLLRSAVLFGCKMQQVNECRCKHSIICRLAQYERCTLYALSGKVVKRARREPDVRAAHPFPRPVFGPLYGPVWWWQRPGTVQAKLPADMSIWRVMTTMALTWQPVDPASPLRRVLSQ